MIQEFFLSMNPVLLPVLIFFARISDVSFGTFSMICTVRGRKLLAVVFSFLEILIWLFAASTVLTHLSNIATVLAYAGGYSVGRAVGIWCEGKLAIGTQMLTFISRGRVNAIAACLRFADHSVTEINGDGKEGPVSICNVVLPRRQATKALRIARQIDPDALVIVEDVRDVVDGGALMRSGGGKSLLPWRWGPHRAVPQCEAGMAASFAIADVKIRRGKAAS